MEEPKCKLDSSTNDRLLIEQKYGGHVGFQEGGVLKPNTLTWLDKTIIDLASSLRLYVQLKEE